MLLEMEAQGIRGKICPINPGNTALIKLLNMCGKQTTFESIGLFGPQVNNKKISITRWNIDECKFVDMELPANIFVKKPVDGDHFQYNGKWYAVYYRRYYKNGGVNEAFIDKEDFIVHEMVEQARIVRDIQNANIPNQDYINDRIAVQQGVGIHATPTYELTSAFYDPIVKAFHKTVNGAGHKFYEKDVFINSIGETMQFGTRDITGCLQYTRRIITLHPEDYINPATGKPFTTDRPEFVKIDGENVTFYSIYLVYKVANVFAVEDPTMIGQYALYSFDPALFNYKINKKTGGYVYDPSRGLARDNVWGVSVGAAAMGINCVCALLGKYCRLFNIRELAKYVAVYALCGQFEAIKRAPQVGSLNSEYQFWDDLRQYYCDIGSGMSVDDAKKAKHYRLTTAVTIDQYYLLLKIYSVLRDINARDGILDKYVEYRPVQLFDTLFVYYSDLAPDHHDRQWLALLLHHTGGLDEKERGYPINKDDLRDCKYVEALPHRYDSLKPQMMCTDPTIREYVNYIVTHYSQIIGKSGVTVEPDPQVAKYIDNIDATECSEYSTLKLQEYLRYVSNSLMYTVSHNTAGNEHFVPAFPDDKAITRRFVTTVKSDINEDDKDYFVYFQPQTSFYDKDLNMKYCFDFRTGFYYHDWDVFGTYDKDIFIMFMDAYGTHVPYYPVDSYGNHIQWDINLEYMKKLPQNFYRPDYY